MSKYCLSDCAKAKLSALQRGTVILASVVGAIFIGVAFVAAILLIVGIVTQLFMIYVTGSLGGVPDNVFEAGGLVTTITLWFSFITYVAYKLVVSPSYKGIKALVTNKFYIKQMKECKIFVKCED